MIDTPIQCKDSATFQGSFTLSAPHLHHPILAVKLEGAREWITFEEWLDAADYGDFQMPVSRVRYEYEGCEIESWGKTWTKWDELSKVHYVTRLGAGANGDLALFTRAIH